MRTNIPKLKQDINETAARLKVIKGIYRESGQPNLKWENVRDRQALKKRATLLCSLRAHLRGKIHLKGTTAEEQQALIEKAWQEYRLGEPQEEAA